MWTRELAQRLKASLLHSYVSHDSAPPLHERKIEKLPL